MNEQIQRVIIELSTNFDLLYYFSIHISHIDKQEIADFISNMFLIRNDDFYLLYLIRMIHYDITNIQNREELGSFLQISLTSHILAEMRNSIELQKTIKFIVSPIITELNKYNFNINLSVGINNLLRNKDRTDIYTNEKFHILSKDEFYNIYGNGYSKYTLEELRSSTNDNDIKVYLTKQISICDYIKNENYFSGKDYLLLIGSVGQEQLLTIYQYNLSFLMWMMNTFIDSLINNINLFPIDIKCICKAIYVFAKQKYENVSKREAMKLISKFLIEIIIIPMMLNAVNYDLVKAINCNELFFYNIKIFTKILSQLCYGLLFTEKEAEYAFMNPLLFSFLPKIFSLFNKLIDFEFPSIINDYIINVNNKEWIDNYMTTIKSIPMMHSVI